MEIKLKESYFSAIEGKGKIIELILDMGNNALKVAQCHTEPHTDQRRPLQSIFAKSAHLNICIDECYELNSRGSQQWDVV